MTLAKIMAGVAIGFCGSFALTLDEMTHRDAELLQLKQQAQPLQVECPEGTVTVATKTRGRDWSVRCAGRGKVRTM